MPTRRAVVLAAGQGTRLGPYTEGRAKCLVLLRGRPLIEYLLRSLRDVGVQDVLLVVGYHGEQVQGELGDGRYYGLNVSYVWNHQYYLGNASSLCCALPVVQGEPFLLAMADHLVSVSLLGTFLAGASAGWRSALAVDRSDIGPVRLAEATKVVVANGMVTAIGKRLERWDAVDVGLSSWLPGALGWPGGVASDGELAAFIAASALHGGGVVACDVTGHFWLDIDTEDDLRLAEHLLAADERLLA